MPHIVECLKSSPNSGCDSLSLRAISVVDKDHTAAGVFSDVAQGAVGQRRRKRNGDGPNTQDPEQREHPLGNILHQDADSISARHSTIMENARDEFGKVQYVGVAIFFDPIVEIEHEGQPAGLTTDPILQSIENPAPRRILLHGRARNLGENLHGSRRIAQRSDVRTILLLTVSNIFMTFAWYGHLRFREAPIWTVIIVSWLIAFLEYCFQVPANRYGSYQFSPAQLKTIQEVITLVVFSVFSVTYLREEFRWNYAIAFVFLVAAVFFMFKR